MANRSDHIVYLATKSVQMTGKDIGSKSPHSRATKMAAASTLATANTAPPRREPRNHHSADQTHEANRVTGAKAHVEDIPF